jgi:hypothetical protein
MECTVSQFLNIWCENVDQKLGRACTVFAVLTFWL